MGLDDGEWIDAEATGDRGATRDEEAGGEWAEDGWPGRAGPTGNRHRGDRGTSGFSVRVAAVVALLAAAAGVAVGLLIFRGTAVAEGAGVTPGAAASPRGGAGLPALPGRSGSGNGRLQMMLTGRVLAVSDRSITIGGNGPSVTAAVTRSTKITGAVSGIGEVKVGAEVSAQITGTGGDLAATAIQDPAVT
jgi:hypothetical protein